MTMSVFVSVVAVAVVSVCWLLVPPLLSPSPPPVWGGDTHKHFTRVQELFSIIDSDEHWSLFYWFRDATIQKLCEGIVNSGTGKSRKLVEDGRIKGGSVAAYYKGELVVDLWGGYADLEARRPWNRDTVTVFYSTTKLMGAVVLAQMVEKGLLDYTEPVSRYWPEFGQNGKEKITVEMLLSHQAGLAVPEGGVSVLDLVHEPSLVESFLARQKPRYTPGSRFGYHGLTWGLYADTLARKVDAFHRNMSQIFHQDIALPFGIDYYIGLPLYLHHRMARVYPASLIQSVWSALTSGHLEDLWRLYWYSPLSGSDWAKSVGVFREMMNTQYFVNDPVLNSIGVTSYSGQGSARGVAKLCSILANNGTYKGRQLLSRELISRLQTPVVEGVGDTLREYVRFGPGTFLSTNPKGQTVFGHPGFGGQVGFADPNTGLGFSFCSNHLANHHIWTDPVLLQLQKAVYEAHQDLQP